MIDDGDVSVKRLVRFDLGEKEQGFSLENYPISHILKDILLLKPPPHLAVANAKALSKSHLAIRVIELANDDIFVGCSLSHAITNDTSFWHFFNTWSHSIVTTTSSVKYGGSSENPNNQVGAGHLFPPERMGIPGRIPEHATGHASTSLATQYMHANPLSAIKYGGPSGNPNVQGGAGDLFPSERMGIRGIILDHATGHASTSLAAKCMPSNENPLSANKYGVSSGNPNIQFGAADLFPADRMDITVNIPEHVTGHASTSLAAQYMRSNANPVSAIKYGGSSGNPNIQVGASDLFPTERMGIPGKNLDHALTSLAARWMPRNRNPLSGIKYGGSSGNSDIQVSDDDLFPDERMGIPGKIPEHAAGHASTYLAAEIVPSNANSLSAIKYGVSSGHPNINICADAMFPAGRLCISADILETETSRMQISHRVTGTANQSYPSFMRNSGFGGDDLLAIHSSTGDADGASSNQFVMSGKPSTELPLGADTSFRYSVPQDLADVLPDVDEPLFGLSALDKLSEYFLKYDTDQSGSLDQIPELFSSPDGNQKVQLGTGEFIPTGPSNGSTSIQAKENAKTGNFQVAANKTVPRSPSNQDILFPPGDNFLRKAPSTGDAPRPSLDYWEQTGQPFSESHSGVDTVACDTLNKNPLSSSFARSTCAGMSLSFSHNQTTLLHIPLLDSMSAGIS
ncbi:hypothetical protein COCNU_02G018620 [Cocos nucifera]|uniref:Uncharacterized protein n=1 Tax=Cocos nucifera TaxID=13894 RepID=A0A8K0MYA1_COCNU|nr:hypothetical protein COCNU_02G018620 [Cocos nucifera]